MTRPTISRHAAGSWAAPRNPDVGGVVVLREASRMGPAWSGDSQPITGGEIRT